jgi:hypothetical protein
VLLATATPIRRADRQVQGMVCMYLHFMFVNTTVIFGLPWQVHK